MRDVRVGIDLVEVAVVRQALREHGHRYLERVYSAAEVQDAISDGEPEAARLAARFAAKEATLKALRVPEIGIAWPSMSTVRAPWGGVTLELCGSAAAAAAVAGLDQFDVSLTHDGGYAAAVVIASGPCGGEV